MESKKILAPSAIILGSFVNMPINSCRNITAVPTMANVNTKLILTLFMSLRYAAFISPAPTICPTMISVPAPIAIASAIK
ncbi:hypothetical protein D3C76_1118720 [compost metagenome]